MSTSFKTIQNTIIPPLQLENNDLIQIHPTPGGLPRTKKHAGQAGEQTFLGIWWRLWEAPGYWLTIGIFPGVIIVDCVKKKYLQRP